jgi:hypothetical protein
MPEAEIHYYLAIEGEEERELSRMEWLKFWLPPTDTRTWQLHARYPAVVPDA